MTWGFENRSVAIRVKAGRGDATHIEDRLGCAASNPYLALAGMLVAMLDGIARAGRAAGAAAGKRLPARRPASRSRARSRRRSRPSRATTAPAAFHPEFVKAFLALKRHEIAKARAAIPGYGGDAWHDEVTDWERGQFLFLA